LTPPPSPTPHFSSLPGRAWLGLSAVLAKASLIGWFLPANVFDWQPALAAQEPWRAFTAAFIHWSPMHLGANLLGVAVVAALGVAAQAPLRLTLAWLAAWPLTQLGLLMRPELAHYGGLSGVLHAGVAAAALWLVLLGNGKGKGKGKGKGPGPDPTQDQGRRQALGGAILLGLLIKLGLEQPWGPTLRTGGGWDIALAPLAHATGAVAGALCALLAFVSRPKTKQAT
jgi:rhomboid family GlyGly-CTERM serine protease